ncbi:MAG: hypothetical protein NT069_25910 [Planctomycetota bacterium]|nr:hypothetical protein [Planctomycetota bacterium]
MAKSRVVITEDAVIAEFETESGALDALAVALEFIDDPYDGEAFEITEGIPPAPRHSFYAGASADYSPPTPPPQDPPPTPPGSLYVDLATLGMLIFKLFTNALPPVGSTTPTPPPTLPPSPAPSSAYSPPAAATAPLSSGPPLAT